MAEKKSVVTPERFAKGLTYKDYLAQIKVNKDRFEEFYKSGQLSVSDKEFFRKIAKMPNGAGKILVIGEDWCPDVFRGLPAVAHIAEDSGMELRIFPREQNLDIMNEFLKEGKYMSLPVVVFYTRDQRYIFHWIERPLQADKERAQIMEEAKKEKPGATEQEMRAKVGDRSRARYPAWQQETIRELREALAKRLGV